MDGAHVQTPETDRSKMSHPCIPDIVPRLSGVRQSSVFCWQGCWCTAEQAAQCGPSRVDPPSVALLVVSRVPFPRKAVTINRLITYGLIVGLGKPIYLIKSTMQFNPPKFDYCLIMQKNWCTKATAYIDLAFHHCITELTKS